jgi:hypothetical protein
MQEIVIRTFVQMQNLAAELGTKMREQRGQTSVEWAGIAFVVVALALALSGLASQIAQPIVSAIGRALNKLT